MTRILNIAHRGGAGLWPENTLGAFKHALALPCDGVELDCHLSKDGEIVVIHDEALDPDLVRKDGRWLEAKGPLVKNLTYAELRQFDVGRVKPGSSRASRWPHQQAIDGERIPRLGDCILMAKRMSKEAQLWIELKSNLREPERTADPEILAGKIVALLRAQDFLSRAVLVSFNWAALMHAKSIERSLKTFCLTLPESERRSRLFPEISDAALIGAIKGAGAGGWLIHYSDLTPERVGLAREFLDLAVWTVNDDAEMKRLIALKPHAICTDYPDRLKAALAGA